MITKLLQGWNFLTNLNVLLKKRTIIVKIREKMMDLFWQETTVDVYNNNNDYTDEKSLCFCYVFQLTIALVMQL